MGPAPQRRQATQPCRSLTFRLPSALPQLPSALPPFPSAQPSTFTVTVETRWALGARTLSRPSR